MREYGDEAVVTWWLLVFGETRYHVIYPIDQEGLAATAAHYDPRSRSYGRYDSIESSKMAALLYFSTLSASHIARSLEFLVCT